jgi:hypothetical protein
MKLLTNRFTYLVGDQYSPVTLNLERRCGERLQPRSRRARRLAASCRPMVKPELINHRRTGQIPSKDLPGEMQFKFDEFGWSSDEVFDLQGGTP